uniref:Uncharacterized protein AlNc14C19G2015 n=1 Tax=Albugo laibachii Nc14 TaxID=890382 RepID=F0W544_9STRA|nr:conserved hypothetical protein [Albugo laibachii Nc14]|eukprot:CCA16235.1 conserved hypothetical protein [Albugo laibachii Nc14]
MTKDKEHTNYLCNFSEGKSSHQVPTCITKSFAPPSGKYLQNCSGMMEVKFKTGAFSIWNAYHVRLQGRWLSIYKRENDISRVGGIELGRGVYLHDHSDEHFEQKNPRQIGLICNGGILSKLELRLRLKSGKEREMWIQAIDNNIKLLTMYGSDAQYGLTDIEHVLLRIKKDLSFEALQITMHLFIYCATGKDIVQFLMAEGLAKDRQQAVALGKRLVYMNYFHHITWRIDFVDTLELYTITDWRGSNSHMTEHFQKYMDTKRFWKFFDCSAFSTASSDGQDRTAGSLSRSSLSAEKLDKDSNASRNRSVSGIGFANQRLDSNIFGSRTQGIEDSSSALNKDNACSIDHDALRKAKKCTTCGKSFNPLRRKYLCRRCSSIICGHCGIVKKLNGMTDSTTARLCVACMLGTLNEGEEFSMQIEEYSVVFDRVDEDESAHSPKSNPSNLINEISEDIHQNEMTVPPHTSSKSTYCVMCKDTRCVPIGLASAIPYPCHDQEVELHGTASYLSARDCKNEQERLKSVEVLAHALSEGPISKYLDQMVLMAKIGTHSSMAMIGLLCADDYIVCSKQGIFEGTKIDRKMAFASHTCCSRKPLVCSDLSHDCRFAGNPWRLNHSSPLFYAGIPIRLTNGHIIGALEVFDTRTRCGCVQVINQLQSVVRGVKKKLDEVLLQARDKILEHDFPEALLGSYKSESDLTQSILSAALDSVDVVGQPVNNQVDDVEPQSRHHTSDKNVVEELPHQTMSAETANNTSPPFGQICQSDIETKLMELLHQTTDTQEQLRNQQGNMVLALNTHSNQINELAKQLQRMESTLAAKLSTNRISE